MISIIKVFVTLKANYENTGRPLQNNIIKNHPDSFPQHKFKLEAKNLYNMKIE